MTKAELSKILNSLNIPVNEGITDVENEKTFPRIDYWEFLWDDVLASGSQYEENDTYQVSFYSRKPPRKNPELLELRELLREQEIYVRIEHEFISKDRVWHSYMALEVTADE